MPDKKYFQSDEEYEYACEAWKILKCKTFEDYHDKYLLAVILLAGCFHAFRKSIYKREIQNAVAKHSFSPYKHNFFFYKYSLVLHLQFNFPNTVVYHKYSFSSTNSVMFPQTKYYRTKLESALFFPHENVRQSRILL